MGKRLFKPTVKSNGGPCLFRGWAEYQPGDRAVVEYQSTYMTMYRGKENPNHKVKVIECNFTVEDKEKGTVDPTGQVLVLNSAGSLNKLVEKIKPGFLIEFEYDGKKPGKDDATYHTFSVLEAGEAEGSESDDDIDVEKVKAAQEKVNAGKKRDL